MLEYLSQYFEITVFYYNPNIYPEERIYKTDLEAAEGLIDEAACKASRYPLWQVLMIRNAFYEMASGLEHVKEGGARCMKCYELRLREAAEAR